MAKVASVPKSKARSRVPRAVVPPGAPDIEYLKNLQLPEGDGEPLESDWHVVQIWLLNELVGRLFGERTDFFCGGNMFSILRSPLIRIIPNAGINLAYILTRYRRCAPCRPLGRPEPSAV